jgi:hypothetical protein
MKPKPAFHPQKESLDPLAVAIAQRLVRGQEPWIRPEERGRAVVATDLIAAMRYSLKRLGVPEDPTTKAVWKELENLAIGGLIRF